MYRKTFRPFVAVLASVAVGALAISGSHASDTGALPPAPPLKSIMGVHQSTAVANADVVTTLVDKGMADPALGPDVSGLIIDADTGKVLFDKDSTKLQTPASTIKLVTGAVALHQLGTQFRFHTPVIQDGSKLYLVGMGDPTLRSIVPSDWKAHPPGASKPPSLDELAKLTAKSLEKTSDKFSVYLDDSFFTGPIAAKSWPDGYIATGEVAPVQALCMDNAYNGSGGWYSDCAETAVKYFVKRLTKYGVDAEYVKRRMAPPNKTEVAFVESATLADIVEQMITTSDNTYAEFLAHRAGATVGLPSFDDGAKATIDVLNDLEISTDGLVIKDGSGLSREDRITARTLVDVLNLVEQGEPQIWPIVTGLPIAGVSGTLKKRFKAGSDGRGTVRAKTGLLTGVVSLAGTVVTESGDNLIFAFMADSVPNGSIPAQVAIDSIVKNVAACGCEKK